MSAMNTPTIKIAFGALAFVAMLLPSTAFAADEDLTEHLEYLSRNGRWEQVLEVVERSGGGPELAPFKARAQREVGNLYKFLRVRNAHKRKDYGTAILVARDIEPDSVYRDRADKLVKESTQRYGGEETNRAVRAQNEATRNVQLNLVLALRPGFARAQAALDGPMREVAPVAVAAKAPVKSKKAAKPKEPMEAAAAKEVPKEPAVAAELPASPAIASAGQVVSLDELGDPPAPKAPGAAQERVNEGRAAADQGDLAGAATKLREAVAMDANHAPAYLHLGVVEHARGNRKDAVEAFKVFLRLAPDDPKAAQLLAYVRDNDSAKAGLDARQCMGEASKASGEGNLEGAIAWLHKAAVADPAMPEPWLQLGMMLERVGRADNARKAYGRYLELAPEGSFAKNARAGIDRLK
jgi:Flp pilus assembly protein TadD